MDNLRILVVEDQDQKYDDVFKKIKKRLSAEKFAIPRIVRAACYTDAIIYLQDSHCDILILDLKIPFVAGGEATFDASVQLLNYISKFTANRPFRIIGLTAYPEDAGEKLKFGDSTILIETYSALDNSWLERIISELKYLMSAKTALLRYFSESYDLDVLILVARYENEYVPVRKVMDWVGEPRKDPRLRTARELFRPSANHK